MKHVETFLSYQGSLIDPIGFNDDFTALFAIGWQPTSSATNEMTFVKVSSAKLTVTRSVEVPFRLEWSVSLLSDGATIGYATRVLRPGDMNIDTLKSLAKEALSSTADEIVRWTNALNEVRAEMADITNNAGEGDE